METTFGEDWATLFDLKCAHCNKPNFFQDEMQYFHTIDFNVPNFKSQLVKDP